jgi:plasmid stability protein
MHIACEYRERMKMLQIRNVPDDVHRQLKARAAMEGKSLSELALGELRRSLERPTRRELVERVRAREQASVSEPAVEAVRAERQAR